MTIFEQNYIHSQEDTSSPEHYLWTSVLSKAAHDALYASDWRESKLAIAWFKGKGIGFRKVCGFAGRDPDYVYKHIMKPIAEREKHMKAVTNHGRIYVEKNSLLPPLRTGGKIFHSHYRGLGRHTHLEIVKKRGRPRKKDPKMVLRGSKGGRPKLYVV
tara:strand:+ start:256 stop:729 length:474 start_codon:yes stop_codon:yes gene_type:complete